jgi:hypothetical protein
MCTFNTNTKSLYSVQNTGYLRPGAGELLPDDGVCGTEAEGLERTEAAGELEEERLRGVEVIEGAAGGAPVARRTPGKADELVLRARVPLAGEEVGGVTAT